MKSKDKPKERLKVDIGFPEKQENRIEMEGESGSSARWDDPVWQKQIMQSLDAVKRVLPNSALSLTVEIQRLVNGMTAKEAAIQVLVAEKAVLKRENAVLQEIERLEAGK